MARGWYSYHNESPKEYFEEQYQIYIDVNQPAWERYNAINRMDKVLNWIIDMPNQDWAEEYIIDRGQKRFQQIHYNPSVISQIVEEVNERESIAYQHYFYIVEMYDKYNRLLWTKIGATKNYNRRMKQHYGYYPEVWSIKERLILDTEDVPAEEVESKVRTYLLKRYGRDRYIPNDRFARKINLDELVTKLPKLLDDLRKAEIV